MAESKTRGVRIHQFGGPDVLHIEETVVEDTRFGGVQFDIRAIGIQIQ